ncbi:late embryogenesis abundant protein [Fructobacillus pseudoficulneus]|uniref:Late embryogenesis abundant protein n=1 Tax=Fructobacillus pseudoficulneus TaxID=220714 RepID=A0A3F3GT75_9LACO|nr:hypothetical protein [Fructobacillus pseudoficulneus]GAP02696.1 late embryogenesis abundant protein [Fructobacillus pseudoficulneus]SEH39172.1 hypothetical protein SAMN05660469_0631 [Fructobacillus pseudoficulneus]
MKNFLLGASLFGNAALAYLLLKDDERVADFKQKANDWAESGKEKGEELFEQGKQKASELTEAGKEKVAATKTAADDSLDEQLAKLKKRAGVDQN